VERLGRGVDVVEAFRLPERVEELLRLPPRAPNLDELVEDDEHAREDEEPEQSDDALDDGRCLDHEADHLDEAARGLVRAAAG
jgi:hypothetical protein